MGILRSDVSGIYKPEDDNTNRASANFAADVTARCEEAKRIRNKKDRYGPYSSAGAKGSPARTRLSRRISSQEED